MKKVNACDTFVVIQFPINFAETEVVMITLTPSHMEIIIICRFFSEERGKPESPSGGKPLRAEKRTNNLNLPMTPSLEIKPGPHWWEASALTTAPPLLSPMIEIVSSLDTEFLSLKKSWYFIGSYMTNRSLARSV